MAMDLYSENLSPLGIMSPRISFSHDLSSSDINFPVEQTIIRSISSPSPEFDFCNHRSFDQHSVSAEDIFLDGKLLPTDQSIPKPQQLPASTPPPFNPSDRAKSDKKYSESQRSNDTTSCIDHQSDDQKKKSKSFWQFKRSSSLNSGNTNSYARSLCPIPLLSRSNSAGSATSSKRSSSSKESHNHNKQQLSQKTPLVSSTKQSQLSSSNSHQKPPLKKNGYGGNNSYGSSSSHGNGVRNRINPVLNVPSANLFGLGSIFSTSSKKQEKNKKY